MSKQSLPTNFIIPCRVSWCHVAIPNKYESEDETDGPKEEQDWKYIVQALVSKTDKASIAKIKRAEINTITEQFGKDKVQRLFKNPKFWRPLRDADEEEKENPKYKGMMFMTANVKATGEFDYSKKATEDQINNKTAPKYCNRPGVILKNRTVLKRVQDIEKEIYAGCYVYLSINAFAFYIKSKGAYGVTMYLKNILKIKDGERLDFTNSPLVDFAEFLDAEPLEEEFGEVLDPKPDRQAQVEDDDPLGLDDDDDPLGLNEDADPLADDLNPFDDDIPF